MPATLVYQGALSGWTHITVVYENRRPKLYLNGALAKTGVTSAVANVHVGTNLIGGGGYGYYQGTLDKVEVYSRALSSMEVSREASTSSSSASIEWLISDQLGTPRMVIDKSGSLSGVKRHDYLPFGEEIGEGVGGRTTQQGYVGSADGVRQGFTGYEKDGETGLNYAKARYLSSTQGRLTSPDPLLASGRPGEPQSWNRYSYVLNNPLAFIDPSGLIWGRKDGIDRYTWFDTEDAMKEAGYSAVTNFLYERDGSFYAVNPNANEWQSFGDAWDAKRTYWGYIGLEASWQDWVPVWGQFRQMMFNIATENYEGVMGNFALASVDGGTMAAGVMGRGGVAAGSLVEDAARAVADDGMTTLYRAVSHAEFEQVMKDGVFKAGPNSLGGKFFAESAEHAAQWGQRLEGTSGFRIVDAKIPTVQADKFMRWERLDGIGPARYSELNQLRNAAIGVVK
jgi:RHS repeat-associated protein